MSDITSMPVTLGQAMEMVEAWPEGFGFQLHRIARTLYEEVCRLRAERDAPAPDHQVEQDELIERFRTDLLVATDGLGRLARERDEAQRLLDAARQYGESLEAELATKIGAVYGDRDSLQEKLIAANDKLIERNDDIAKLKAVIATTDTSAFTVMTEYNDKLAAERDQLKADYAKLDYQTRMMGLSLADKPDGFSWTAEAYPMTRVIDLMDGWRDDVENWGLHQMCRVLRAQMEQFDKEAEQERDQYLKERAGRWAERDDNWEADQRAIKLWQEAHPDSDVVLPNHADMVVWLLDAWNTLATAAVEAEAELDGVAADYSRALSTIVEYDAAEQRALAAVPCARAKPDGAGLDCTCPDYRWAPCCNLRIALLPGEPFQTDYLADSGEIHLLKPGNPEHPGAPLKSAGGVKLIEPTYDYEGLAEVGVSYNGSVWVVDESALNLSCIETADDT